MWLQCLPGDGKNLLHSLLAASPFGICVLDRDLKYLMINDALAAMNGLPAEAHVGRTVGDILPALEAQARVVFATVAQSGQPVLNHEFRGEALDAPGLERVFNESWFPMEVNGEVRHVGVLVEEITERRSLEQQLLQANLQKDQFLAFLSHELRNALNPSVVALRAARQAHGIELREQMLTIVERNHAALGRLLDDLLDVARITRGMLSLKLEKLDLRDLIRAATEDLRAAASPTGVGVSMQVPLVPVDVEVDRVRIGQVLANLTRNALNHCEAGHTIEIALRIQPDTAEISVEDTGAGIAAEHLSRLFDPFFTTGASTAASGGLGIGLTLVQTIVSAHGGVVAADSKGRGHGSTFRVHLPFAHPPAEMPPVP